MRKSRGITTYSGAHRNTALVRGKATGFACHSCGGSAHEWALIHGAPGTRHDRCGLAFSTSPADYMPMCRRCHRVYDKSHITHCPKGHAYEGENVLMDGGKRKCRTCVYERNRRRNREHCLTPERRSRKSELQRRRRADQRGAAA